MGWPSESWQGNGMDRFSAEQIDHALTMLGMMPVEIASLARIARVEADTAREMSERRGADDGDRARWSDMASWWQRRALKWKEIEARTEHKIFGGGSPKP